MHNSSPRSFGASRGIRRCPSCERPVAGVAGGCPYCGEDLPGRWRARMAFHAGTALFALAAVPHGIWGGAWLASLPFAALLARTAWRGRREVGAWCGLGAAALLAILCALDASLRYDAARLWTRHGVGIGLALVAVSTLCRDPEAGGVASDSVRGRLLTRLAAAAVDAALLAAAFLLLR